ncbi:hypothetical protein QEJ31_07785 [Pigmentibacter sp. JX0631]|uniref:hypothetical protein n=1 Tax=Pigmentibacter sp. JX0631 TaxID=2976982 RepID=UPI0024688066|nr:hypothetical protein [Pigmentibacter sp. JX0631]WGL61489.1 hypothetical protein QEJ31_07785 [Pigmentibacter sp. JX0631]
MQGKIYDNSFISTIDYQKVEGLRKVYEWIQLHTELCHLYANIKSSSEKEILKIKVDESFLKGKELMDEVFHAEESRDRKTYIPLSGMNRFASNSEDSLTLSRRDLLTNLGKSEVPALTNVKKAPLPSRTYLKKK